MAPLSVCLFLAGKYATALVQKEHWTEFASVVRVWKLPDDEPWNIQTPKFSALLDRLASFAEADGEAGGEGNSGEGMIGWTRDAVETEFIAQVHGAFFSNALCDLFAEPLDSMTTSAVLGTRSTAFGSPYLAAQAVLESYGAASDDVLVTMPDSLCAVMDAILLAARAIVAVSSPVPCEYGSSYEDVTKVFGSGSEKGEVTALIQEGMDDLKTAANKNQHWRARIQSYYTLALNDAAVSKQYRDLTDALKSSPVLLEKVQS